MLVLWAVGFASGVLLAAAAPRVALASGVVALVAAAVLARCRHRVLASALLWLALGGGAGWWELRSPQVPPAIAAALASGAR